MPEYPHLGQRGYLPRDPPKSRTGKAGDLFNSQPFRTIGQRQQNQPVSCGQAQMRVGNKFGDDLVQSLPPAVWNELRKWDRNSVQISGLIKGCESHLASEGCWLWENRISIRVAGIPVRESVPINIYVTGTGSFPRKRRSAPGPMPAESDWGPPILAGLDPLRPEAGASTSPPISRLFQD